MGTFLVPLTHLMDYTLSIPQFFRLVMIPLLKGISRPTAYVVTELCTASWLEVYVEGTLDHLFYEYTLDYTHPLVKKASITPYSSYM